LQRLDATPSDSVDTTKGSPSYTLNFYVVNTSNNNLDFTPTHLYEAIEQFNATPTTNSGTALVAVGANTLTASETAGPLNAACISWNNTSFPLEVYAMGVGFWA
jgi:hypothetical protein